MTPTLYSLRTDPQGYRITKWVDGDVESSYITSIAECNCPAGHRHTCRHRQMLPQMLAHGLADTHWFWSHDRGYACDFQGGSKALADALTQPPEIAGSILGQPATPAVGEALLVPAETKASPKPWRRF